MTGTTDERRRIMRAVRSRDTAPEITVRRFLHKQGYRYRLHARELPGVPDIVFRRQRRAIFIHGCFWHGHDCPRGARKPRTNSDYWAQKIERNRARDALHLRLLTEAGWQTLVVWECELKTDPFVKNRLLTFLARP